MTGIRPKIVDGEPYCDRNCPIFFDCNADCGLVDYPCGSGLRKQRDNAIASNEAMADSLDKPWYDVKAAEEKLEKTETILEQVMEWAENCHASNLSGEMGRLRKILRQD